MSVKKIWKALKVTTDVLAPPVAMLTGSLIATAIKHRVDTSLENHPAHNTTTPYSVDATEDLMYGTAAAALAGTLLFLKNAIATFKWDPSCNCCPHLASYAFTIASSGLVGVFSIGVDTLGGAAIKEGLTPLVGPMVAEYGKDAIVWGLSSSITIGTHYLTKSIFFRPRDTHNSNIQTTNSSSSYNFK